MLSGIRQFCDVRPDNLSKKTFSQIIPKLSVEFDGSPRWIEKQMQYLINDAYKTGRIIRFNDYSLARPVVNLKYPMTYVEFASEVRSQLIYMAMREAKDLELFFSLCQPQ